MAAMPKMKQITIRFSPSQLRALAQLARKLEIDRANVIRLAVAKLAESEGVGTATRS